MDKKLDEIAGASTRRDVLEKLPIEAGRSPESKASTAKRGGVRTIDDHRARRRKAVRRRSGIVRVKTEALVELVGSKAALSRLLGVARTQPGRWISGAETPSPDTYQRLTDLEYLLSRVADVWYDDMVMEWMTAPNPFLDDARPIDVVERHGPGSVIAAVDAEAAGSYA